MTRITIGRDLMFKREAMGLTLVEVAMRMRCDPQVVKKIEVGAHKNNSLERLQRYAQAIGCELRVEVVNT